MLEQVLIIDNDLLFLKNISYQLMERGYNCKAVSSAEQALGLLRSEVFDLVITDLLMPGMDGLQFLNQVRSLREYKYTPIIIITSASHDDVIVNLLSNGADDVLIKPVSINVLYSKIGSALARNQFNRDHQSSYYRSNLNLEYGSGVFCTSENQSLFNDIGVPMKKVCSYEELLDFWEKNNVWFVLVDAEVPWAVSLLKKIRKVVGSACPIIMLPGSSADRFEDGLVDFQIPSCFHPSGAADFFNFILQREMKLKTKYIDALSLASSRSPFVAERRVEQMFGSFAISVFHEPLDKTPGGDFYEVLPCNDHQCVIVFGDVMGKAWDAWFLVPAYIAYIRSVFRFIADSGSSTSIESPAQMLETINTFLYKDFKLSNVFTTLQIIVLNKLDNTVVMASAGALLPISIAANSPEVTRVGSTGKLLGLDLTSQYQNHYLEFEPGDVLALITDGYNDITTSDGHIFVNNVDLTQFFEHIPPHDLVSSAYFDNQFKDYFRVNFFNDDRSCIMISTNN